jgi:hypothetical protein
VFVAADMGHVDPSLAERQRMLKKARLADSLNDQLSHRPGPLELIKKNILHTEEPIERAVKGNVIYIDYLPKLLWKQLQNINTKMLITSILFAFFKSIAAVAHIFTFYIFYGILTLCLCFFVLWSP